MYAMTGTLTAQAGQRKQLAEILVQASRLVSQYPECLKYIVAEDVSDESKVVVFEVWTDKEAHDASLKNDKVRALIAQALPLLNGAPTGAELNVIGGHGV